MPWLRRILRASGGPRALLSSIDQFRLGWRVALPACLALSLASLASPARGADEAAPAIAGDGNPSAPDPAAGKTRENQSLTVNLPDADETPREARRDESPGDSGGARDGDRRGGPEFGGPRGRGFRGGWGHGFRPGWHHGPGHWWPRDFAGRDHGWHRGPHGGFDRFAHRPWDFDGPRPGGPWGRRPGFGPPGGPRGDHESREIIRLLHELRDEVARLNSEIRQLRGERRAGGFRGPPGGHGRHDRMRGEWHDEHGRRDGPPADLRGPDGPRFDRRGPGGPPAEERDRERRRPEREGSGGGGGPDGRGSREQPQRTGLDDQPPRGVGLSADQPRAADFGSSASTPTEPATAEPAKPGVTETVPTQEE